MDRNRLVSVAGLVLLIAGLVLGLAPVGRDGASCGRAWQSSTASASHDLAVTQTGHSATGCQGARAGRMTASLVALIPGALLLLVGVAAGREATTPSVDSAPRGT